MEHLYLILNLGSLSVPFLFSFHPKLKFYTYWKALFLAIGITMAIYIPWDVIFTQRGIWGFNDTYFLDTRILKLPLEEWLFFICIPYACVFTHYALLHYFPNMAVSKKTAKLLGYGSMIILFIALMLNLDKWYTLINFGYAILLIGIALRTNIGLLQNYFLTFLVMLLPFFIVNGILTGSLIDNQVVWYNDQENLGIRVATIPIEDSVYAFTLILTNLLLTQVFQKRLVSKQ